MNEIDFSTTCACFNVRKAARAVTSLYDAILRPTGLRATQVTLLMAAASADSVTISQLAEILVMDRTTLARDLKPLQELALVSIVRGVDRRTRLVQLTDAGWSKLDEVIPRWQQAQTQIITNGLGPEQWRTLYNGLQDVVRVTQA